jgi:adenosylmethionine-8-amino-7-oxononanoate aminotransferase
MTIYPGTGTADGVSGDHVMLCPSYIVSREDIQHIAHTTARAVTEFFAHPM